ncbi:hypothetical protein CVD25_01645 [Bacillus canaveralius]|uniref:YprB ribonuclease H-like domain-containing protein n=1 Tax=Bacillus canaveralius TaxID=1403243 RepID=A0A2N5GHZ3_9BACI|nr:ribonuclease H-like domain-containing protein [Bacillus canaveralius]PLR80442.1 hypothetical protein CU635_18055 [Bacillus canaveralius]PLS00693.1 hypothetical protein CVD25_01645 [Bacillus canaveralius]
MTLKNKLNRLKPHLASSGESAMKRVPIIDSSSQSEIPFLTDWVKENTSPYYFDNSYCLIREVRYPLSHRHGKYVFADFLEAVELWNHTNIVHPLSAAGCNAQDLFFFDTETTGLGGGTGNTIFLLGHASFSDDHIVVKQHILPHPGAEIPLYQSFLENVNYQTLVTYNGKSFDWPQVKTRHTLIREHVPKLPLFGHFDLYHASRRLWKHKLERLKLSIVEKEILQVERIDDIPGFLAPIIYFDFVERKNPEGMFGIIKHNEIDILSLITLYTHLSFQLLRKDTQQTTKETFEVGRWYASVGNNEEAANSFLGIIDGTGTAAVAAKLAMAYQYKQQHDWSLARKLFIEIAAEGNEHQQIEALVEAAKIVEHRDKNYREALGFTDRALEFYEKQTENEKNLGRLLHRKARLMRKIALKQNES